jgi:hypothetical protein
VGIADAASVTMARGQQGGSGVSNILLIWK